MIKNISKNTILANAFEFKNGLGKIKGLISLKPQVIAFKTRFGIHTFFMKFPIDVLVLNKNKKVVFFKENIKPNRIVLWNPRYDLVIELPQGSIKESKTELGDIISLN
jgi:uncharacterized protein